MEKLSVMSYKTLRDVEDKGEAVELMELDDRSEEEKAAQSEEEAIEEYENIIEKSLKITKSCTSEDVCKTDEKIEICQEQILDKMKSFNFEELLCGLTETDEKWNKTMDYKKIKKGKRTRYYTEGWKKAAEIFLKTKTSFKSFEVPFGQLDDLIPVSIF